MRNSLFCLRIWKRFKLSVVKKASAGKRHFRREENGVLRFSNFLKSVTCNPFWPYLNKPWKFNARISEAIIAFVMLDMGGPNFLWNCKIIEAKTQKFSSGNPSARYGPGFMIVLWNSRLIIGWYTKSLVTFPKAKIFWGSADKWRTSARSHDL